MEPIRMELEGYQCPCPGTPHSSEWVELEPSVTVPMGMAAMYQISRTEAEDEATNRGALAPILMRFGIRAWSFTDVHGASMPIHSGSIEALLPFADAGYEVADKCFALYLGDIIRPLLARRNRRSGPGPMVDTTSPIPESGQTPQTLPSRYSRKAKAGSMSEAPAP
jgi:hypothetical protein